MPPLLKLILMRLGLGVLTLFLVSLVVFVATQALPGDPARPSWARRPPTRPRYEALRRQLNLDRPVYEQYLSWLNGVVAGRLPATSIAQGIPVTTLLKDRVVNSAVLVFVAALISIPFSILIGSLTALWRDSKFDTIGQHRQPRPGVAARVRRRHHPHPAASSTAVFNLLPAVSHIDPSDPALRAARTSSSCRRMTL